MSYNSYDNIGFIRVLKFLKTHNNEYLSGEDLSDVLKISRVAVWKHIKKIRTLGYEIESKQKRGYKLVKDTELSLPWEITDGLQTKYLGKKIYYYNVIDSTQDHAVKISMESKEHGSVIIANKQTKGKGRDKKRWISPKGGIWLSIILHPDINIKMATLIPLAASVAISRAIYTTLNIETTLKWPNDILIGNDKVAGILTDAQIQNDKIINLVLGIGINYNVDARKIHTEINKAAKPYGITSIKSKTNTKKLIQQILMELEDIFTDLSKSDAKKITTQWSKRSSTIGRKITTPQGIYTAVKIDNDGALTISQNGKNKKITHGTIQYL